MNIINGTVNMFHTPRQPLKQIVRVNHADEPLSMDALTDRAIDRIVVPPVSTTSPRKKRKGKKRHQNHDAQRGSPVLHESDTAIEPELQSEVQESVDGVELTDLSLTQPEPQTDVEESDESAELMDVSPIQPELQSEVHEPIVGAALMDVSLIQASDRFRCRPDEDANTVEEYAEKYGEYKEAVERGDNPDYPFDPIWIWWDGEQYHLVTGFHRRSASISAGMDKILVQEFNGTEEEAMKLAMTDNNSHGLRMRYSDWKYCIGKALRLYPHKTAGAIAKELGCHRSYAYKIEHELSTMGQLVKTDKKCGADGKVRTTQPKSKKPPAPIENVDGDAPSTGQDASWSNMSMKDKRRFVNGILNDKVKDLPDKASKLQFAELVKEWADKKIDVLTK